MALAVLGHKTANIVNRAVLTADNAVAMLHNFCGKLPQDKYSKNQPIFIYHTNDGGQIQAEVILPVAVDHSVRRGCGHFWWESQRAARRDVAFCTLKALYTADLLTDHLLPSSKLYEELYLGIKKLPPRLEVMERLDPWASYASKWTSLEGANVSLLQMVISRPGRSATTMYMIFRSEYNTQFPRCELHWTDHDCWHAEFYWSRQYVSTEYLQLARSATRLVMSSVHRHRMSSDPQGLSLPLLSPCASTEELQKWLQASSGQRLVSQSQDTVTGIVRHPSFGSNPLLLQGWPKDYLLEVQRFPRRRNFLHRARHQKSRESQLASLQQTLFANGSSKRFESYMIPANEATFDNLDEAYVQFAQLLPSIIQHIETSIVATQLNSTILSKVGFDDIDLVKACLSASSAFDAVNYQRLEFIGDSVLKFIVSVQLFAQKPLWHEGYLTRAKSSMVANATLTKAALSQQLDRYVTTAKFSPRKWKAMSIDQFLGPRDTRTRKLSAKVIADVVEALIGAAYVQGGLSRAVKCVHLFMSQVKEEPPMKTITQYRTTTGTILHQPVNERLLIIEEMIGYKFHSPVLLAEALTHSSASGDFKHGSYERLEFLGDAVLEMLLTQRLSTREPPLSHMEMHLMKDAMTNRDILAYFCFRLSTEEQVADMVPSTTGLEEDQLCHMPVRRYLYQFMKTDSLDLAHALQQCHERFETHGKSIQGAIEISPKYPRSQLLHLGSPKCLSDLVESILGAIFIDSGGDLTPCEKFGEHIGLLTYLDRCLRDKVDILHPKSRLSEMAAVSKAGKVKYNIGVAEDGKREYTCRVTIGEVEYPEVRGGVSKDDVTTLAAERALEVLRLAEGQGEEAS